MKDPKTNQIVKKEPHYLYVHIIFNRPVSDKKVSHLLRNDTTLKENLCSLKQVHFTAHPYDEGLFSLKLAHDLPAPGMEGPKDIEDHLISVLSCLRRVRAVQLIFNSDSGEMNELVDKVSPKIQAMLDDQASRLSNTTQVPPVFLLLMDRTEDLITPFIQNNSYSSLYFTLLGEKEHVLKFKIGGGRGKEPEEGVSYLNENDNIWTEHKYRDYLQAMDMVINAKQRCLLIL